MVLNASLEYVWTQNMIDFYDDGDADGDDDDDDGDDDNL